MEGGGKQNGFAGGGRKLWPLFAADFGDVTFWPVSARENQESTSLKSHLDRWLREADAEMKRDKDSGYKAATALSARRLQLDKRNRCVKSSKLFWRPQGAPPLYYVETGRRELLQHTS